MESWDFLQRLGLDLASMNISFIRRLQVSAVNGRALEHELDPGGFGISRYRLDQALAAIAKAEGVTILENTKVNEIVFDGSEFTLQTSKNKYTAFVACGCFGKRSNIDIKWKRSFVTSRQNRLNNFVGVKYHVKAKFPNDTIALHNFNNGYCGISKIEDDKYCFCYLTRADNLSKAKDSIAAMEQTVLMQNPHLREIMQDMEILYKLPVTISQISFDKKTQVENHVLMIGDAAGMITPLCGNGMSMALHAAKLAAEQIDLFFKKKIERQQMESEYGRQWRKQFANRLKTGRRIQRLFGKSWLTNTFIEISRRSPWLVRFLVRQTHGNPY